MTRVALLCLALVASPLLGGEIWRINPQVGSEPLLVESSQERIRVGPGGWVYTFGGRTHGAGSVYRDGQLHGGLARLDAQTGRPDPKWRLGAGLARTGRGELLFDSQGRIYVGAMLAGDDLSDGDPQNFTGRMRLVRLLPDGSIDSTYQSPDFVNLPQTFGWAGNGRIVVVDTIGDTILRNGPPGQIVILGPNGEDQTPPTVLGPADHSRLIRVSPVLDSAGRILIGGTAQNASDAAHVLVAVFPDGTVDPTFVHPFAAGTNIRSLIVQPDGRIIVAGMRLYLLGVSSPRYVLLRLLPNGALDSSFTPVPETSDNEIQAARLLGDGRIQVSGIYCMARYLANGTADPEYPAIPFWISANGRHPPAGYGMDILPDGTTFVVTPALRSEPEIHPRIIRITPAGSVDPRFVAPIAQNTTVSAEVITRADGSVHVFGGFSHRGREAVPGVIGWSPAGHRADPELEGLGVLDFSNGQGIPRIGVAEDGQVALHTVGARMPYLDVYMTNDEQVKVWDSDGQLVQAFPSVGSGTLVRMGGTWGGLNLPLSVNNTIWRQMEGDPEVRLVTFATAAGSLTLDIPPAAIGLAAGYEGQNGFTRASDRLRVVGQDRLGRTYIASPRRGGERLVRLRTDGSWDEAFASPLFEGDVAESESWLQYLSLNHYPVNVLRENFTSMLVRGLVDRDGELWIFGGFSAVNGVTQPFLVRLDDDGILDPGWALGPALAWSESERPVRVDSISIVPSGKIWVAGSFDLVDGAPASGLLRLHADGSLDPAPDLPVKRTVFDDLNAQVHGIDDDTIMVLGPFAPQGSTAPAGAMRLERVTTVGQSLAEWKQEQPGLDPTRTMDADGVPILLKYLTGMPVGAGAADPQELTIDGSGMLAVRLDTAASAVQVTPVLQFSPDLLNWERVDAVTTVETIGDRRIYTVQLPLAGVAHTHLRWAVE